MQVETSESLVAERDPDRFSVLRMLQGAGRQRLLALYALNLSLAQAAWASDQPMVAEMRLQWWIEALEALGRGEAPRAHPVLEDCAFLQGDAAFCAALIAMAETRRWDIWAEPFADNAALWAHLDAGIGALMGSAARALGATPEAEAVAREFGTASALANWFEAVPALSLRERPALPDLKLEAIAALAEEGRARLKAARRKRHLVPSFALPALLSGWEADALLKQAARDPAAVLEGRLGLSEMHRRGLLAWRAISGRW